MALRASRASPSSSSDVEEIEDIEDEPALKKRRLSGEESPDQDRCMETDDLIQSDSHDLDLVCPANKEDACSPIHKPLSAVAPRPGPSSCIGPSRTGLPCNGTVCGGAARPCVGGATACPSRPGTSAGSSSSCALRSGPPCNSGSGSCASRGAGSAACGSRGGGCPTKFGHCVVRSRGGSTDKETKSSGFTKTGHRTSSGKGSGSLRKEQWLVPGGSRNEDPARWREGGRGVEDQITSSQGAEPAEVASLQAKLRQRDEFIDIQKRASDSLFRELQESVECPVCFSIPRSPPVPCCQNGHVICSKCKEKVEVCPTCRVPMMNCVNQVAATIIQHIQHPCNYREAGCDIRCDINTIDEHEERCGFRLVRCPHWACDETLSLTALTSHVISSECGDNYMSKALPYQEEIEYTRALDDQDGSSFWRPSLLQFHNITFYLQIEKSGKNRQWYFYVQMEGSSALCERYETQITVCKSSSSDRFSISYYGKVCPIDTKGAEELDTDGCGLNVRDAVMEKIFTVDAASQESACAGGGKEGGREGEGGTPGSRPQSGEKEEGEVGDQAEEGEGERYKFWVKVDIFKVND